MAGEDPSRLFLDSQDYDLSISAYPRGAQCQAEKYPQLTYIKRVTSEVFYPTSTFRDGEIQVDP